MKRGMVRLGRRRKRGGESEERMICRKVEEVEEMRRTGRREYDERNGGDWNG